MDVPRDKEENTDHLKGKDKSGDIEETVNHAQSAITDLVATQQWLDNQIIQYKTQLKAAQNGQDRTTDAVDDPDQLLESISQLQTELQEVSTDHMSANLQIERMEQYNTFLKHLYPDIGGSGDTSETSSGKHKQQEILKDLVTKQTLLVSKTLECHKENQSKSKEIHELQADNLDLKHEVRELMYNLQKIKERQDGGPQQDTRQSKAMQKAQKKLDHMVDKAELVRNIYQGLILGSGINWAQDKDLTQLLLSLGKPLDSQI